MTAQQMPSSLEIAQSAVLRPIDELAAELGLLPEEVDLYGRFKAKIDLSVLDRQTANPNAKLIDVTAITPTKAGEGKTTTSVSLTQGLGHIGKEPVLCLREASLGPVFGIKGGAAGGGYAQVVPMEDMNLHFTGDIHAIGAANNLLAAMVARTHPPRQQARDRSAGDQLAPLRRHQRSRPARHRDRPRRPAERVRPPVWLRYHGGI
jgi:formate--tetrahydrofolate ligase